MTDPRPTVLIVDDSPLSLHVLNRALRDACRIKAARGGLAALAIAARDPLDLILLDREMPDLDGEEVCRRLKADPRTRAIPVVFITGSEEPVEHAACRAAGALACLIKPVDVADLLARLPGWIGRPLAAPAGERP